jgi:hypothetical protein
VVLQSTVKKLEASGPMVEFKVLEFAASSPPPGPLGDFTEKLNSQGLPVDRTNGLVMLLAVASMTPGTTSEIGQTVSVRWESNHKNLTIVAQGKLLSLNLKDKTLTVSWDLTEDADGQPPARETLSSVYSTEDFSLKSSTAKLWTGDTLTIKRL